MKSEVIYHEIYKEGKLLITLCEVKYKPPTKEAFALEHISYGRVGKIKIPCFGCDSYGWVYDPDDPPCPVEGNKMRDRIKCQYCKGTGEGDQATLDRLWKKECNRIKQEAKDFKAYLEEFKDVCSRYTLNDLEFIRKAFSGYSKYHSTYGKQEGKKVKK